MTKTRVVICELDGDMWCAHGGDFINLQESKAEFGKTPAEAAFKFLSL